MGPITGKLVEAIKLVGKNGGYVYIMDVSAGIPYISETLSKDVTADVKSSAQQDEVKALKVAHLQRCARALGG